MTGHFDPYHLRPLASLNRRAVVALPGVESGWVGKNGSALLSKSALVSLIGDHAQALGLDGAPPSEYPRRLNALLDSPGSRADPTALAIADEFGGRLGALVASIMRSPDGLTSPLDAWEAAYLRQWKEAVGVIFLGGGHASGALGESIARAAQAVLERCGVAGCQVLPAAHPAYLPLIGAARGMQAGGARVAVVADFGGTRAKTGLAFYDETGRLGRLKALPPTDISAVTSAGDVDGLAAVMVRALGEAIRRHDPGLPLARRVVCSVAAYVEDGQPLNIDRGIYTWLNRISPNLKAWFSQQVSRAGGVEVAVEFAHDCDAAACALAGHPRAAVIMLGSALGVGFVPPCPVAEEVEVEEG